MKKEALTIDNIKRDLHRYATWHFNAKYENYSFRYFGAFCCLLIISIVGFMGGYVIPAVLALAAMPHTLMKYVKKARVAGSARAEISAISTRDRVSVSVERLSHISEAIVHQRRVFRSGGLSSKRIPKRMRTYHFEAGRSWCDSSDFTHYEWSDRNATSPEMLSSTSLAGDEFYFISLQMSPDVTYIYPTKFFELDEELNGKKE